MQKWEYIFITIDNYIGYPRVKVSTVNGQEPKQKQNVIQYFQQLGAEGWELASTPTTTEYIFKRPLP